MTDADHLSAAQRLEPLVASVRDRLDRERRLPDELIQAIGDAGLFGMWLPRAMGGPELPPLAFLRVVEELSRQDGSIGWCTAIAAGHGRFAGALPHRTACEIFGSGRTILAGTLNPAGKAVAVPGGYRVTGRWRYGSVIDHSAWVYGNCVIHDEAGPRQDEGGMPLLRLCLFPKSATEVIDAWQVSGLRGTGSHDFQVTELLVPEHNTIPLADFTPVPTQPGAIYAIPMASIFASVLAAIVLGIARAAIEALMVLAADKTPAGSQSVLRENALPQADLARAEAFVRGGRAFLFDEVETMWQEVQSGREMTIRRRGLIRLAACQATQWAIRAVDLVYAAGGGSSIREANRFERCFRDAHAAAQHFSVSEHSNLEPIGRVLFGLPPGAVRF
ncbi:MAG TPA: acyl-CoA dehydrogenase family protein [Propionibacteriaceae bacterium]|nr:acyl-CoA dehydrogenase family protein [Propionibacteriaceae bacterium]